MIFVGFFLCAGLPSIEKCKKARMKREDAQELAELDVSNIITTQGTSHYNYIWCSFIYPNRLHQGKCICIETNGYSMLKNTEQAS